MKRFRNGQYALAGVIALLTFLLYLPALQNEFVGVWDDNAYVVENAAIRSLNLSFFRWAFLDFYASNWHPLTWMSHALDYAVWGLDPRGHHLTNIVLHACNTALVVLLALLLLEMTRERSPRIAPASFLNDRTILIAAGVTGTLFGVHPLHVESVAWVAERKDLLCALFFLMSIIAYAGAVRRMGHGAESKRLTPYALCSALCLFVLALMSKPMAVSLPVVLLVLDWYPFGRIRSWKALWPAGAEKLPFIALSLASSIMTVFAQRAGESVSSLELIPLSTRLLVAARSLVLYLGKMALPLDLVPYYPYPREASLLDLEYGMGLLLAVGITAACAAAAKKRKVWLSAWGCYAVMLLPVLGIVQVGHQAMAERYTYLPSIGPFLIAGLGAAWIAQKASAGPGRVMPAASAAAALALMVFLALSYVTVQQIGVWKNGFVLWDHVIAKGIESATAYNNRGLSLEAMGQQQKAMEDYNRAVALEPWDSYAYNNLGALHGKEGQYGRSIEYFQKAIALNPKHASPYCNLGLSYFNIQQFNSALENYNRAIGLKRDFDAAYLNRGNLYFITGNTTRALADYRKACDLGNARACEVLSLVTRE